MRAYPHTQIEVEQEVLAPGELSRFLVSRLVEFARESQPVLLCGETGTGKTLLAGLLHAQSPTPRALRVVNCAALSDGMLADRLRDLDQQPVTLFLDEVGELSPWGQAVLLQRLQQGNGQARFVSATHRDLDQMVQQGSFSGELLSRLSRARLVVSPLRARREDIVPLALHFLRLGLRNLNLELISVEPDLFNLVEHHDWPGNVRELRNAMTNALAVNESGTLDVADLPDTVRATPVVMKGYSR